MNATKSWGLVAVVALAAVAGYFALRGADPQPDPLVGVEEPSAPAPINAEPSIQYPIEAVVDPAAEVPDAEVPALDESDAAVSASLDTLLAGGARPDLLLLQDVIRRVVVTVDNLPRERFARRLSPVKSAEGGLLVSGDGNDRVISEDNRARYAPYVALVEAVDIRYLAALYARFYPLFQQAYQELGYPQGYFNDRLVAVLDHLLATPEPAGPLRVVQPKVLYQFADPELERLSAGQKILVRMGPDNAARVKARLRELRRRVAGGVSAP